MKVIEGSKLAKKELIVEEESLQECFTDPVPIEAEYQYKWSHREILARLRHFQAWLSSDSKNWQWSEYLEICRKQGIFITSDWFYSIKHRFERMEERTNNGAFSGRSPSIRIIDGSAW